MKRFYFIFVLIATCLMGAGLRPTLLMAAARATGPENGAAHAISVPAKTVTTKNAPNTTAPTWSHDVAPIVYKNCSTCHHAGGAGPFSLLTYADAKRWAPQILDVTQSRFMPPWLPEPGYGDFADVRRLNDNDRAILKRWIDASMPAGDASVAPEPPHYDSGWMMGKPDLVLKVEKPYRLAAGGTDFFSNLILPYPLKETHFIRAMEIKPGAPQVVHHANVLIDRTAAMRLHHPNDWQEGVPGMEQFIDAGDRFDPDSHFLFWKPDSPALVEPEGMPWRLDPGNDLILNIHLKPSGKNELVAPEIGLYFSHDPPTLQPMLIALERDDKLDIPAGDKNFVVEDSLTLPVDVKIYGSYPHAHYLGHDMQGWATLPSGEKKWLVWIRNWDIDRQSVYRYREPILLPRGTVLHMRYTYDNSAENVHNQHNPPIRVRAGNRSEDEMAHLWLQVLPVNAPANGPDPRLQLEEAWMRRRVEKTPDDQVNLYNLASALAGQGKYAEAEKLFQQNLKLSPGNVRTLTALGVVLESEGKLDEAAARYKTAVGAAPPGDTSACDARFDEARITMRLAHVEEAEVQYRALLRSCNEDAEMRSGLGVALIAEGKAQEGEVELRRAIELDANDYTALYNLGALEADDGHFEKAIDLLAHAVKANPSSPDPHEKLAAVFAQQGKGADAVAELRAAVALSPQDAQAHAFLSQALDASGQTEEGFAEQKRALELDAKDADGWNHLGTMLERGGQIGAARSAFEHALSLQPDHPQAKANLAHLPASR